MHKLKTKFQKLSRTYFKDRDVNELLKGGSIVLLIKVFSMALGYIIMIYLSNKFGAKIYGQYALGITVLSITILLPRFGLDTAVVRIIGELKLTSNYTNIRNVLKKVFSISFLIGLLFSLLIFFFSSQIAVDFFKKPNLIDELSLISWIILPMTFLFLIAAYFQAYKKTVYYILFNSALINIIFIIILLIFDFIDFNFQPFFAYALAIAISFFIAVFVITREVINSSKWKTAFKKNISYSIKDILKISSPMLLSSSFVLIMNWLDIIMLGVFSTEESVGIYNASQRIAAISGIMLFAVNAVATPKFIEFYAKRDFKGLEKTAQNSTKLIFFLTAPILLIFVIFPKAILGINGIEFIDGYTALIFLCLGKFVNSIAGSVGFILQMTDNQKVFQNVLLLSAILNGILNFFLIPKYGFNGAAFASMLTIAIWNIILVIVIKRKFNFWTYYIPFLRK